MSVIETPVQIGPRTNRRKRFSVTRLKTYMDCPLKAHFRYDLHLPSGKNAAGVFGNCMHDALEIFERGEDLERATARFIATWTDPEILGLHIDSYPKRTSWDHYRQRGVAMLEQMAQVNRWDDHETIAVEREFLVPFGQYEIHGFVDKVEVRTSGKGKNLLRIVDYKTGSRAPNRSALYMDIQFTAYVYASLQPEFWLGGQPKPYGNEGELIPPIENAEWWMEMVAQLPRRPIWYHVADAKEIDAGDREDKDFAQLYRVMVEIDRAQRAGIHIPRIGEACELCDYVDPCGLEIPSREDVFLNDDNQWL